MPRQPQPERKHGAFWNDKELAELLRKQRDVFKRGKKSSAESRYNEDRTKALDSLKSVVPSV